MEHILTIFLVRGRARLRENVSFSNNLAMRETLELSITPKKTVRATQEPIRILGIEIDGTGELRRRSEKIVELIDTTVVFCRQKTWSVKQLKQIFDRGRGFFY